MYADLEHSNLLKGSTEKNAFKQFDMDLTECVYGHGNHWIKVIIVLANNCRKEHILGILLLLLSKSVINLLKSLSKNLSKNPSKNPSKNLSKILTKKSVNKKNFQKI